MFCNQCGAELKDGANFCTKCGAGRQSSDIYANNSEANDGPKPVDPFLFESEEDEFQPTREKLDGKLKKWLIASVILTILFGFSFYKAWNLKSDPENVAERYFISMVNGDNQGAFDCLGLSKTEWLNPDTFEAYIRLQMDDNDKLARIRSVKAEKGSGSKSSQSYRMNYLYGEADSKGSYDVTVDEDNGSWRVPAGNKIIENAPLCFPKGAEVTINGVKLTDKYLDAQRQDGYNNYYVIPEMFMGTYLVEVKLDGYENYAAAADLGRNGIYVSTADLSIAKKDMEELEKQAGEDLKKLYQAVIQHSDFAKVKPLFTDRSELQQGILSEYEYQVSRYESSDPIINFKMGEIKEEGLTNSTQVTIRAEYTVNYVYESYYGSSNRDYKSEKYLTMSYVRDGDAWKLDAMPDLYTYY